MKREEIDKLFGGSSIAVYEADSDGSNNPELYKNKVRDSLLSLGYDIILINQSGPVYNFHIRRLHHA